MIHTDVCSTSQTRSNVNFMKEKPDLIEHSTFRIGTFFYYRFSTSALKQIYISKKNKNKNVKWYAAHNAELIWTFQHSEDLDYERQVFIWYVIEMYY